LTPEQFHALSVGDTCFRVYSPIRELVVADPKRVIVKFKVAKIHRGTYTEFDGSKVNRICTDRIAVRVGECFLCEADAAFDMLRRIDLIAGDLAEMRAEMERIIREGGDS
jgi:hypothetical protein